MIAWLSAVGACAISALAAFHLRRGSRPQPRDQDWGDWPSDQMAP